MECEGIFSFGDNIDGEELKVGKAGLESGDGHAIPNDVDGNGGFLVRRAERAGLEEADLVALAGLSGKRASESQCAGERINTGGRSKERNSVTAVSERLEEEDGSIKGASCRAGTDPIGVLGVKAEIVAFVEVFKSSIDDEVLARVTTGESNFEVALTGVDSS